MTHAYQYFVIRLFELMCEHFFRPVPWFLNGGGKIGAIFCQVNLVAPKARVSRGGPETCSPGKFLKNWAL